MELIMIVLFAKTNTSGLESSNAQIKRLVTVASVQNPVPLLSAISAEYYMSKLRRREHEWRHPRGSPNHWRRVQVRKTNSKHAPGDDKSVQQKKNGVAGALGERS